MFKKIMNKKLYFEIETIRNSGLFDMNYYQMMYPEIAPEKLIEHYLQYGDKQQRNPNQQFDKKHYIETYPEVSQYEYHPFVHYILIGQQHNYSTKSEQTKLLQTEQYYEYSPIYFSPQQQPCVTIIVPVYNSWHHNYNCLRYIWENCKNVSYEVIVADDCSSDQTKEIEKHVHGITYLRNAQNLGFLRNCNNATKHARGKYIFLLNSDALIQPQALQCMLETLENDEKVGICGAKLVMENGSIQIIGGFFRSNKLQRIGEGFSFCDEKFCHKIEKLHFVTGAAFVIRAELWRELGGFDERYVPAYYEDNDLCLEVCKRGYQVVCNYNAVVVHLHSISYNKVRNVKKIRYKSRKKFYQKWQDVNFNVVC
ncbi:glycosyltransferase family 2 protein [Candidatus Uabimicrobium amorphum]|uniref:Glycosyl transferase family protein n=1 Tax=Uabimicrobium amorphum TaxID=2596890 RepID=A0A5S9ISW2_UABAM|nr:glycosyltransferase family 2 protein [Candidatus Uabimicrobium amorphum]BBM87499.1 glycosyl transferase family protein [Candidatus Uabimicrobium amorphum]